MEATSKSGEKVLIFFDSVVRPFPGNGIAHSKDGEKPLLQHKNECKRRRRKCTFTVIILSSNHCDSVAHVIKLSY